MILTCLLVFWGYAQNRHIMPRKAERKPHLMGLIRRGVWTMPCQVSTPNDKTKVTMLVRPACLHSSDMLRTTSAHAVLQEHYAMLPKFRADSQLPTRTVFRRDACGASVAGTSPRAVGRPRRPEDGASRESESASMCHN